MDNNENEIEKGKQGNGKSVMICAYASLAISLLLAILWICNVGGLTVVTLETFVGVIVALLAIIVTIAIIWQIYNAIDMRNKVEELKQLESQLEEQKKSFDLFKHETADYLNIMFAKNSEDSGDYSACFCFLLKDLEALLQLHGVDYQIEKIELTLKWMKSIINRVTEISSEDEKLLRDTDKAIRGLSDFRFIKSKYEPIFKDAFSKIKGKRKRAN